MKKMKHYARKIIVKAPTSGANSDETDWLFLVFF